MTPPPLTTFPPAGTGVLPLLEGVPEELPPLPASEKVVAGVKWKNQTFPRTKNTMVVQASGIAQKKMKITRLLFLITSGNDSTSIIVERIVHVNPTAP